MKERFSFSNFPANLSRITHKLFSEVLQKKTTWSFKTGVYTRLLEKMTAIKKRRHLNADAYT
jgi:hypothetical protein